jgi:hypothetical protein
MSVCSPESQGVRGGYLSCDEALSGLLSHSPDSTAHGGRGRGRVLFQEEGEETHACMATLYAQVRHTERGHIKGDTEKAWPVYMHTDRGSDVLVYRYVYV